MPKPQKDIRNNKQWVRVKNTYAKPNTRSYINAIIVAVGESFRMFGNMYPKYRIIKESENPDDQYPICEEIKGFQEYFAIANASNIKKQPQDSDVYEGMGRGIFLKYLFFEDDVHFRNACLTARNYFVVFDHDQIFGFITQAMMKDRENLTKFVRYDISNYPQIDKQYQLKVKKDRYFITNLPPNDMGTSDAKDYPILPDVKYHLPRNWEFKDYLLFSTYLSKHPRFLNEKHFTNASFFVMQNIHFAIWDKVIFHKPHRDKIQKSVKKRVKVVLLDSAFCDYLRTHRLNLLKIIFYELNDWLENNKQYQYKKFSDIKKQKNKFRLELINQFNILLNLCKQPALTKEEIKNLDAFIKSIDLKSVISFYEKQSQPCRASLAREKMTSSYSQMATLMPPTDHKDNYVAEQNSAQQPGKSEKNLPLKNPHPTPGKKRHQRDELDAGTETSYKKQKII